MAEDTTVKAPDKLETVPDTPASDGIVVQPDEPEEVSGQESLTDEQLAERIKTPPETSPEKETKPEDKAEIKPEVKEEKKPEEVKLFADKYKTEADLEKGILELAKFLKLPESVVGTAVETAKTAKDWSLVEKMYKAMESEKGKVKPAPVAPPVQPAKVEATSADDKELLRAVGDATFDNILSHNIVQQMRAEGFEVPRTQDELKELWKAAPWLAGPFVEAFKSTFNQNLSEAREYQKALTEVESANKQTTESETTGIRDFCTKNGIAISDQDIADLIVKSQGSPLAYEDRHGIQFLKPGGLMKYFMAEEFPPRMQEFLLARDGASRKQAIEDYEKLKSTAVSSISTASPGSGRQTEEPKIDLNSEKDVQKMGDKKLTEKIADIFKKL